MASPEFIDPYLDPQTRLLRNLVGAQDQVTLDTIEGDLVFVRLVQLMDHPPPPTGDLAELQAIHHHLFQDIYDWAGQPRTVDMSKNVDGGEPFLPFSRIEHAIAISVVAQLREERILRGLGRERFIARLAHHYDQLNYVHPFRDGNGRTQRVFWSRIAREAGWELDWLSVQGAPNDAACRRAAEQSDLEPLRAMFDSIVSVAVPAAHRTAVENARHLGFLRDPSAAAPPELPIQGSQR